MGALLIQGRYEVIRRLAIGGMGEIFLARQTGAKGFSRLVILKTLRPELSEEPGALDQFLDEARVAALLNHPNIVAVYEVGVHDGVHFIAMEYIGGVDLSALLRGCARQKKRVPLRVAAAIIRDAASALDFAHHARDENGRSLHVVHRDVSPQNLMIRSDGLVKVVDFGVAVSSNQMHETQGDKLKGKIRYMSPEQLLGEELDGRSDIFSLGIVFWELCANKPLFSGSNPIDIFQKILAGAPPSLAEAAPETQGALADIVHKMLATKRTDRYARGDDVAHALRGYLDATGGAHAADEVQALVHDVAGAAIADRVKDLSERAVSFTSSAAGGAASSWNDSIEGAPLDTNAATRVVVPSAIGAASSSSEGAAGGDDVATRVVNHPSRAPARDDGASQDDVEPIENSEGGALLWAAEHSGVLHGDRRFVTVLFGLLPGWGQLAQQIANVPMGAFGVGRLKNLFFRQLVTLATDKGGTVVRRGPDSFVVAFGLDEPRPQDAERALACAFATQKLLDDLARDPSQRLVAHMGVAGGLALATDADEGPVQLAGAVADKAERLAALARTLGKGVLVSGQVGELARGSVALVQTGGDGAGDPILEATGLVDKPEASRVRRRKILIADDAEVFRRIEEEILRPFAYAFVHAKNGAEAARIAVDEVPDLILLDIQMPVMDGVQVLSLLKKTDKTKHIPVVVITTIGRAHDEDLVRRGGADAFLTKPVKPGVLIQTVRNLLKD